MCSEIKQTKVLKSASLVIEHSLIALFITLLAAFSLCNTTIQAQKKVNNGNSPKLKTQKNSKVVFVKRHSNKANRLLKVPTKILSAGIVNNKALNLVKPEFPAAAKTIGVYGQIIVQVLIDEEGNVQEAKAIAGHPLMRYVSIQAARSSKFEPFTLDGRAIKASGIIIYNYLPESFNWLEIGYILQTQESGNNNSFYTFENFIKCFPLGFDNEKQLVGTAWNDWENRTLALQSVQAMIEGKLIEKPKEFWLFSLGKVLADVSLNTKQDEILRQAASQSLRLTIQTAPENTSSILITDLEQLIFLLENAEQDKYNSTVESKSNQIFNNILARMSYLGR